MNRSEMFFNVELNYWWDYDDKEHNAKYVVSARSYSEAIGKVEEIYDSSSFDIINISAEVISDTEGGTWEIECDGKGELI